MANAHILNFESFYCPYYILFLSFYSFLFKVEIDLTDIWKCSDDKRMVSVT